jgi:hypothetical protein
MYLLGGENTPTQTTKKNSDVDAVDKAFSSNSTLKTAISRINTEDELSQLLTAMVNYVNKDFTNSSSNVKMAYSDTINTIPKYYSSNPNVKYTIKEQENTDVINVEKTLDKYPDIKRKLQNINNKEELKQIIMNDILANIDPKLSQDKNKIIRAVQLAQRNIQN